MSKLKEAKEKYELVRETVGSKTHPLSVWNNTFPYVEELVKKVEELEFEILQYRMRHGDIK